MVRCTGMAKGYLPYDIDQRLLLPPDMRAWLPEGHLSLFILDVVGELDLSQIYAIYDAKDERGRAGYHPAMMVALLVYAYCVGKPSSRRIERATYEDVAFRVLAGDQHPDHDSIAAFRKQHLEALGGLFTQVLQLCQKAGLVKLGHIAIDGTKIKANASKHKAMSYERMGEAEKKLQDEVQKLLAEAERIDAEEDAQHGQGRRGDEVPKELKRREDRLRKIREAKAALEQEAKEKAAAKAAEATRKRTERERDEAPEEPSAAAAVPAPPSAASEPAPTTPDSPPATPEPTAQRNFTDPESRIMPDGANKGSFVQGYNAQIAVDAEAQVIVAAELTQSPNDARQLVPMALAIVQNVGKLAETTSADAGYFSAEAVEHAALAGTHLLVPPDRLKHGTEPAQGSADPTASAAQRMRYKLAGGPARALYKMRKAIVEPVFGQIKEARDLRRLLLRGFAAARAEFRLIAMTHNLLKLFRSGRNPALLTA
jgi:transposase